MEWFRFYSGALNNAKVQRLPGELFKFWVNLLCLANNGEERGKLSGSADDIAWALRMDSETCRANLHTLQGQKLLDWDEAQKCYIPHDWNTHQKASDNVTPRVQKFRENSNVSNKEDETLQKRYSNALEQNRVDIDSEIETEEKREIEGKLTQHPAASASESPPEAIPKPEYSPLFEQFWLAYPKRDGTKRGSKADAWKVWNKLLAADRDTAFDMAAVYAKLESTRRENGRYVPDAERWLREKRWQTVDEEAQAELELRVNGGYANGQQTSDRAFNGNYGSRKDEATARSVRGILERREDQRARVGDRQEPPIRGPGSA